MNERIRKLMLEAGYAAPELAGRANKLAELIVKECADVLVAEMNRLDGLGRVVASQTMDTAQVLIKQHFGVEE